MKSWKVLLIAGAVLLVTTFALTTAFPRYKRVKTVLKLYDKEDDLEATKKPKIKVKCAKSLGVIRKVGSRCSSATCPGKAKACRGYYDNVAEKFCVCSTHSIYLKKENACIDLNKPCENAKLLKICHSKASCMAAGKGLYYCKCNKGYTGNGETCQKAREKGAVKVTQDNNDNDDVVEKSSGINVAIIAPAVGVPVVLIVAVVIFCACKNKDSDDEEGEDEDAEDY